MEIVPNILQEQFIHLIDKNTYHNAKTICAIAFHGDNSG